MPTTYGRRGVIDSNSLGLADGIAKAPSYRDASSKPGSSNDDASLPSSRPASFFVRDALGEARATVNEVNSLGYQDVSDIARATHRGCARLSLRLSSFLLLA